MIRALAMVWLFSCASLPPAVQYSVDRCLDQKQVWECKNAANTLAQEPPQRALAWKLLRFACQSEESACQDAAEVMVHHKWPDHLAELEALACNRRSFTIFGTREYCLTWMAGEREGLEFAMATTDDARKALCARGNVPACAAVNAHDAVLAAADAAEKRVAELDAATMRKPMAERKMQAEAECKRNDDRACYKLSRFNAGADPDQQGSLAFLKEYADHTYHRDMPCNAWFREQARAVRARAVEMRDACAKIVKGDTVAPFKLGFPPPFADVEFGCSIVRVPLEYESVRQNNAGQFDRVLVNKTVEKRECWLSPLDPDWPKAFEQRIQSHCHQTRGAVPAAPLSTTFRCR